MGHSSIQKTQTTPLCVQKGNSKEMELTGIGSKFAKTSVCQGSQCVCTRAKSMRGQSGSGLRQTAGTSIPGFKTPDCEGEMSVIEVIWSVLLPKKTDVCAKGPKGSMKDLLDRLSVMTAADRNHLCLLGPYPRAQP